MRDYDTGSFRRRELQLSEFENSDIPFNAIAFVHGYVHHNSEYHFTLNFLTTEVIVFCDDSIRNGTQEHKDVSSRIYNCLKDRACTKKDTAAGIEQIFDEFEKEPWSRAITVDYRP